MLAKFTQGFDALQVLTSSLAPGYWPRSRTMSPTSSPGTTSRAPLPPGGPGWTSSGHRFRRSLSARCASLQKCFLQFSCVQAQVERRPPKHSSLQATRFVGFSAHHQPNEPPVSPPGRGAPAQFSADCAARERDALRRKSAFDSRRHICQFWDVELL